MHQYLASDYEEIEEVSLTIRFKKPFLDRAKHLAAQHGVDSGYGPAIRWLAHEQYKYRSDKEIMTIELFRLHERINTMERAFKKAGLDIPKHDI